MPNKRPRGDKNWTKKVTQHFLSLCILCLWIFCTTPSENCHFFTSFLIGSFLGLICFIPMRSDGPRFNSNFCKLHLLVKGSQGFWTILVTVLRSRWFSNGSKLNFFLNGFSPCYMPFTSGWRTHNLYEIENTLFVVIWLITHENLILEM